jgi:hypothetical protein
LLLEELDCCFCRLDALPVVIGALDESVVCRFCRSAASGTFVEFVAVSSLRASIVPTCPHLNQSFPVCAVVYRELGCDGTKLGFGQVGLEAIKVSPCGVGRSGRVGIRFECVR